MTEKETVLFIGGPVDGKRLPATRGVGVWMVAPERMHPAARSYSTLEAPEPIVYTRRRFVVGSGKEWLYFAPEKMTDSEAFETLLDRLIAEQN